MPTIILESPRCLSPSLGHQQCRPHTSHAAGPSTSQTGTGDTSHSLSLSAVGFLSSDPQVAGGTCSAPSLHAKYPGLPQFLCSQAPCDETCGQPGAVALYPVQGEGGGSDPPTQTRAWGRAAQLLQRWVPASLLPIQGTPWLALPQSVRCRGGLGVGGVKGAWQRLCSGGAWGLTAWYLLGRQGTEAKVAVPTVASPFALYRRVPKCRWCRRAGRCVSRQGMEGGGAGG